MSTTATTTVPAAQTTGHLFGQAISKTYWQSLSRNERAACIGHPWTSKIGSKYAWDVSGCIKEKWNTDIYPEMKRVCAANSLAIYKTTATHYQCSYHLYLLCSSSMQEKAYPTIVTKCQDYKIASRALRIIKEHHSLESIKRLGFKYMAVSEKLVLAAGGYPTSSEEHQAMDQFRSLCGSRVLVSPLPATPMSKWRQATIGGVITLDDRYYGLTVAHCFHDEDQYAHPHEGSLDSDSNEKHSWTMTDESSNEDSSTCESVVSDPVPHGVYLEQNGHLLPHCNNEHQPSNVHDLTGSIFSIVGHFFATKRDGQQQRLRSETVNSQHD